ncbi:MAG: hypothetical protein ACR2IF_10570 [Terriglobales bacterium]
MELKLAAGLPHLFFRYLKWARSDGMKPIAVAARESLDDSFVWPAARHDRTHGMDTPFISLGPVDEAGA